MAATETEVVDADRRARTRWLMLGGAASLVLPLLGVFYLHWAETAGGASGSHGEVFEHREGSDSRLVPTQAVALPPVPKRPAAGAAKTAAPASGSSLDFIKPSEELRTKVEEKPPAPAPAPAKPAPAPAPVKKAPAKAAAKVKKGTKPFAHPKLQQTRGFSNFGSSGQSSGAGSGAAAGGTTPNVSELLKNLPPGAENNPQVQQYLKSQGR
jgi:hypothetical protein